MGNHCTTMAQRTLLVTSLLLAVVWGSPIPSNRALLGGGGGGNGGGPYHTASQTKAVSGYVCGGLPSAVIYYPTDTTKTYPLISFAHGFTAGGAKVPIDYGPKLLSGVASWGYVIVATEDAPSNYCEQETQDQLHSIEVMKGDSRVDWSKPVGLMGHSMGGHATVRSSGNQAAVSKYNIAAAVALHPVASLAFAQPQVPIFYGTGTADVIVPPVGVIGMYYKTTKPGKVIAEITGATHFEPNTIGPNRWTPYAAAYFGCYLYGIQDACDTIYGSSSKALCRAIPMSLCKHTSPAVHNQANVSTTCNDYTTISSCTADPACAWSHFGCLSKK